MKNQGDKALHSRRRFRGKLIKHSRPHVQIEAMLGRLKEWRRGKTCYRRFAKVFLSANINFWRLTGNSPLRSAPSRPRRAFEGHDPPVRVAVARHYRRAVFAVLCGFRHNIRKNSGLPLALTWRDFRLVADPGNTVKPALSP